jgi:hypothetical protein
MSIHRSNTELQHRRLFGQTLRTPICRRSIIAWPPAAARNRRFWPSRISILVIGYHLVQRHEPYRELGADYFDRRRPHATANCLVRRLASLGYRVTLQEQPAHAAA